MSTAENIPSSSVEGEPCEKSYLFEVWGGQLASVKNELMFILSPLTMDGERVSSPLLHHAVKVGES